MRKKFGHLLPLTEAEIERIWEEGTLTVDASVLLDLYRYHPETRDALLHALCTFRGRLWLSHQAAMEFVRNRARAASAVDRELADADRDLDALAAATSKTVDALRGRRPLPREIGQRLKADVDAAIRAAKAAVDELRTRNEGGASADSILSNVLSLFDGCVGEPPSDAELTDLHKEAQRRVKENVPPGYADATKGGANAHGDYFLWHQVLQHAKESAKPVIFVTSERKEDWWERAQGKTLGPRPELLEEANRVAGQRVLIYQTHSFLAQAVGPLNGWLAALAFDDIRKGDLEDAIAAAEVELDEIMTDLLVRLGHELLLTDDALRHIVAGTRLSGWRVHHAAVTEIEPVDSAFAQLKFNALVQYTSAQYEGCNPHSEIQMRLRGVVAFMNGSWTITEHQVESAKIAGTP